MASVGLGSTIDGFSRREAAVEIGVDFAIGAPISYCLRGNAR